MNHRRFTSADQAESPGVLGIYKNISAYILSITAVIRNVFNQIFENKNSEADNIQLFCLLLWRVKSCLQPWAPTYLPIAHAPSQFLILLSCDVIQSWFLIQSHTRTIFFLSQGSLVSQPPSTWNISPTALPTSRRWRSRYRGATRDRPIGMSLSPLKPGTFNTGVCRPYATVSDASLLLQYGYLHST